MHCVSSYPYELNNLNFKKFENIKKLSPIYGYSGHYNGIDDAIVAISNGAKYVEKHFTVNKKLPGRDNKFAILPSDMMRISKFRDFYNKSNKFKGLNVQKCEMDIYKNYRGRWSGNNKKSDLSVILRTRNEENGLDMLFNQFRQFI